MIGSFIGWAVVESCYITIILLYFKKKRTAKYLSPWGNSTDSVAYPIPFKQTHFISMK